jgi:hypothetical protein
LWQCQAVMIAGRFVSHLTRQPRKVFSRSTNTMLRWAFAPVRPSAMRGCLHG